MMKNPTFDKLRSFFRIAIKTPLLYLEWLSEQKKCIAAPTPSLNKLLIVPADPYFLIASKGDEAMITGVITRIKEAKPHCNIGILGNLTELPASLASLDVGMESRWSNPWSLKALSQIIDHYDGLLIIGADVMDGHYSALSAARLWVVADIAARLGKRSVVLGFSFNSHPSSWLRPFINHLSPALHIFLRDSVSLKRFNDFSHSEHAELVADSAFLLRPQTNSSVVQDINTWCESQRAAAKVICGFNIHPMLIKNASQEQVELLVSETVSALAIVLEKREVSFVFISHDYRGPGTGDCEILASIADKLAQQGFGRILTFEHKLHAGELKALAGLMDLVVTGRMHLSIASLGQGTPIAAITYQGKFHGLFQHFNLDEQFLISPEQIKNTQVFAEWIINAIDHRQPLASQVQSRLPEVNVLAEKNLTPLLED